MRMLKVKYILQILFLFLILCCSKDEVENTGRPGVPNLVFPDPDNEYFIVLDELGLLLNPFRGFKLLTLTL